jgi:hypothetical protein
MDTSGKGVMLFFRLYLSFITNEELLGSKMAILDKEYKKDMGVYKKNYKSPEIYLIALEFYDSALILCEADTKKSISSAVLFALSIELFFKSLHACKYYTSKYEYEPDIVEYDKLFVESKLRGHILKKLFDNLPSEIQMDILNKYRKIFHKDITEQLETLEGHFVNGRYFYERNLPYIATSLLKEISCFLKEYTVKHLDPMFVEADS